MSSPQQNISFVLKESAKQKMGVASAEEHKFDM
jgi:hypothetical protein